jgi:hypothetical protein
MATLHRTDGAREETSCPIPTTISSQQSHAAGNCRRGLRQSHSFSHSKRNVASATPPRVVRKDRLQTSSDARCTGVQAECPSLVYCQRCHCNLSRRNCLDYVHHLLSNVARQANWRPTRSSVACGILLTSERSWRFLSQCCSRYVAYFR